MEEQDLPKSITDFIDLVGELREAQKQFFRFKSSGMLAESKRLEQQVDSWLMRHKQKQLQANLFDGDMPE